MCMDRIVSIFCAAGWLMLGSAPDHDGARNGVAEIPAGYTATAAATSAAPIPGTEVAVVDTEAGSAETAAAK